MCIRDYCIDALFAVGEGGIDHGECGDNAAAHGGAPGVVCAELVHTGAVPRGVTEAQMRKRAAIGHEKLLIELIVIVHLTKGMTAMDKGHTLGDTVIPRLARDEEIGCALAHTLAHTLKTGEYLIGGIVYPHCGNIEKYTVKAEFIAHCTYLRNEVILPSGCGRVKYALTAVVVMPCGIHIAIKMIAHAPCGRREL